MNVAVRYAIFIAAAALIVGGVHYYIWLRLVRDTALGSPWLRLGTAGIIGLAAMLVVGPLLSRQLTGEAVRWSSMVSFFWMGAAALTVMLLVGAEVAKLTLAAWRSFGPGQDGIADPERRLLFARVIGGGAAGGAMVLGGTAFAAARSSPEVVRIEVPLTRLPAAMDGFVIVQISDLHVSSTIRRPWVERVVSLANAEDADLMVITGDLVDGSVAALSEHTAPLAGLESRHGTFFCTGNHEYYSGADAWIAELKRLGIRTLRNERVSIGDASASFDLAGIDDARAHQFGNGHGADLPKAVAGRDPTRELVLLAHQPNHIDEATDLGVGLQLSGHTHGGQIWPWGYLVKLVHPYLAGLHKHRERTWIYVSRGTGYWGPPMRLAAQHEVTVLTLRKG